MVHVCIVGIGCVDTVADAQGNFGIEPPVPLPDGAYTITAVQMDGQGCISTEATSIFAVLTPPPIIVNPENGATISGVNPTIVGTAIPGNLVEVCIVGIACQNTVTLPNGVFVVTFEQTLPAGERTVTATQTSIAGSVSQQAQSTFTVALNGLVFQLTQLSMGSTFRTIDLDYIASGPSSVVTVTYLLLAPNAPLPLQGVDADPAQLISGAAARGVFTQPITGTPTTYEQTLTGRGVVLPLPQETGIVDGYNYKIFVIAEDGLGNTSGLLTLPQIAMGMPFDAGNGSMPNPFQVRELSLLELLQYPDLLSGHPINVTGVNETARMLENIERLQVLFDETNGLYGLIDSLALVYQLTSGFDLAGYANAYGGRGWLPIGNADGSHFTSSLSGAHVFTGSLTGNGAAGVIVNLVINRTASVSEWVQNIGLFGVTQGASITNIALANVSITAIGSALPPMAYFACGALIGNMNNTDLDTIEIELATIYARQAEGATNTETLGGMVGYATGTCTITEVLLVMITVTDPLMKASYVGGMLGAVEQRGGLMNVSNIEGTNITLNGYYRVGGCIGHVIDGIQNVNTVTISGVTINSTGNSLGGFVGKITNTMSSVLTDISVGGLTINSPGSLSAYVGGFIGSLESVGICSFFNCTAINGTVHAHFNVGGFAGILQCSGQTLSVIDCQTGVGILSSTNAQDIGGFVGVFVANEASTSCICEGCTCFSAATVYGYVFTGGFVGLSNDISTTHQRIVYTDCETASTVSTLGSGSSTGGFVGNARFSTFTDCLAIGPVSGYSYVGGFLGREDSSPSTSGAYSVTLNSCTPASSVTALSDEAGGMVGGATSIDIVNCNFASTINADGLHTGGILGYVTREAHILGCSVTLTLTTTRTYAGGILGQAALTAVVLLETCTTDGSLTGIGYCGGIAGYVSGTVDLSIDNCQSTLDITSSGSNVGGILGSTFYTTTGTTTSITNCVYNASITGNAFKGGIVGHAHRHTTIANCIAFGSITSPVGGNNSGGIVGIMNEGSTVSGCASNIDISGGTAVGGIAGSCSTTVGALEPIRITDSYSTGVIIGTSGIGGIAGTIANNATIDRCYSVSIISGNGNTGGIVGSITGTAAASDNYAINEAITVPPGTLTAGRITGDNITGTVSNNYAWSGILISGFVAIPTGPDTANGETVDGAELVDPSTEYVTATGWNFATVWAYSSNIAVNLPILLGIPEAIQAPTLP